MNTSRAGNADPVADALIELAGRVPAGAVVDVGGGSGSRAVALALLGCTVLVADSSIDALAILRRRAADAGVADRITAVQADAVALSSAVPPGGADLVLCHHLLETVDDPAAVITGIAGALKPGGIASVLVAGRFAAVLGHAVAGRYGGAAAILSNRDGRFGPDDPLRRRFDLVGLEGLLSTGGLSVESVTGIGVVANLVAPAHRAGSGRSGTLRTSGQQIEPRLAELERALAEHPQLREIATDLHAVARLPAG